MSSSVHDLKIQEYRDFATASTQSKYYDVYFYGRGVIQALNMLMLASIDQNSALAKQILGESNPFRKGANNRGSSYYRMQQFLQNHLITDKNFVYLDKGGRNPNDVKGKNISINCKWAATNVDISNLNAFTTSNTSEISTMDLYKNRVYPIAMQVSGASISMNILENKDYMWYQFLNALGNTFFDTSTMTPRNSLHHLSIVVEEYNVTRYAHETNEDGLDYHLSAVYEFNSVVPIILLPSQSFSFESLELIKYSLEFYCPNPIKTPISKGTLAGMQNRSDKFSDLGYNGLASENYWSHNTKFNANTPDRAIGEIVNQESRKKWQEVIGEFSKK